MKSRSNTQGKISKILVILLCFLLLFQQCGLAQIAGELNIAGRIASIPNPFVQDAFRPLHLRYLSYDSVNNNFKLLLDKGSTLNPKLEELKGTTKQLLSYFSIGLSLPSESFWVNLRPDDEANIIDNELAKTDMGRVMLEADLQLKKDTALSTSPKTPEGKKYWDKLYKKAAELFGSDNVTIPTLTRVWIVPDEIVIGETQSSAYIYKATLKVLLEEDYLKQEAASKQLNSPLLTEHLAEKEAKLKTLNAYSSQLFRETIIPKLTKEVNASKRYAPLRQAYYSLIMAEWFKARFSDKKGLAPQISNQLETKVSVPSLINSKNLNHLTSQTPWSKDTYFRAYQKSVNEGEYDIQQTQDTPFSLFHQTTKRYICGGVVFDLSTNIPALGGMSYTPGSGATTYSIPHANASPAAGNAIGVEVNDSGEVNVEGSGQGPEINGFNQMQEDPAKKERIELIKSDLRHLLQQQGTTNIDETALNKLAERVYAAQLAAGGAKPVDVSTGGINIPGISSISPQTLGMMGMGAIRKEKEGVKAKVWLTQLLLITSIFFSSLSPGASGTPASQRTAASNHSVVSNEVTIENESSTFPSGQEEKSNHIVVVQEYKYNPPVYKVDTFLQTKQNNAGGNIIREQTPAELINIAKTTQIEKDRTAAIYALRNAAWEGDKGVLDFLRLTAKTSQFEWERLAAIGSLRYAAEKDGQVVAALIDLAKTAQSQKERVEAITSLRDAAKRGNEQAVAALIDITKRVQSQEERLAAIGFLRYAAEKDGQVVAALIDLAKTAQSQEERVMAIYSLGTAVGNKEAKDFLKSTAKVSKSEEERVKAIYSLGNIAGKDSAEAIAAILEFLKTAQSEKERIAVIGYLGDVAKTGNKEVVATLIDFAKTASSEKERIEAITSLRSVVGKDGGEVVAVLIDLAKTARSQETRRRAIFSLGYAVVEKNSNNEVVNVLIDLAKTAQSQEERLEVITSLKDAAGAGNKEAVDFLKLTAKTSQFEEERLKAISSLGEATAALIDFIQTAQSEKERMTAIDYLGLAGLNNQDAVFFLANLIKDDKVDINIRVKAVEALTVRQNKTQAYAQIRDTLITIVRDEFSPAILRAKSFYGLARGLIKKEEIKGLIPYLERINKDKDITTQRVVASIITAIGRPNDSDYDPLRWVLQYKPNDRESIHITHNTKFDDNKTGSYDRATVESIVSRAIYLGIDPYLALGVMLAEFPIVVDGRDLGRLRDVGELQINSNAIEDLFVNPNKPESLLVESLSSPKPNGRDVVVTENYPDSWSGVNLSDIAIIPSRTLEGYDVDNIIKENLFLVHIANLDTSLSAKGNLALLNLRESVQNKREEDRVAGLSLALTIQRWNGLGYYRNTGLNIDGINTRVNPIYGNAVLGYIDNALLGNKEIKAIIDKYSQLYGKPAVNMHSGQMKSLGLRDPLDEDTNSGSLSNRHDEFEGLAASSPVTDVYGTPARVVTADLGNIGAYHFNYPTLGLIIVVNLRYNNQIREEGKFHEAREVYWMDKGFTQHEAHVIASAEQTKQFSTNTSLTSYHSQQLTDMGIEDLEAIINEDGSARPWHHAILEKANSMGAGIDTDAVKAYEENLRQEARRLADGKRKRDQSGSQVEAGASLATSFQWLDDETAHNLALDINQALGGKKLTPHHSFTCGDKTFILESDQDFYRDSPPISSISRVLRFGPLIFVTIDRYSDEDIYQEIERLKIKLGDLYTKNRNNIVFFHASSYENTPTDPLSAYAQGMIGTMLTNRDFISNNAVVFDLGAADGLLARVALRMGVARVVLVDNDDRLLSRAKIFLKSEGLNEEESEGRIVILCRDLTDPTLKTLLLGYSLANKHTIALINIGEHPIYGEANTKAIDLLYNWPSLILLINGGYLYNPIYPDYPKHEESLTKIAELLKREGFFVDKITHEHANTLVAKRISTTSSLGAMKSNTSGSLFGGIDGSASSPSKSEETPISRPSRLPLVTATGGIDFRNLPIVRKAIGNLRDSPLRGQSLSRLNSINLDTEWQDIENLVNQGVIPQAERLKEYIQASCLKGSAAQNIDKVISCIADILRLEEERYIPTEPMLQDILIAVESANSIQQLKAAFVGNL